MDRQEQIEQKPEKNYNKHNCDCKHVGCHINGSRRWCHYIGNEIPYDRCNPICAKYKSKSAEWSDSVAKEVFIKALERAAEKVAETIGAITIRLKVKRNSQANDWYRKHGYGYLTFEDEYDWLEKNLEYLKPKQEQPDIIEHICLCAGIPAPFMDGNQWCILKGDNIQVGVVGFGDTKEDAIINFIKDIPIQYKQYKVNEPEYGPYARQYPKSEVSKKQLKVNLSEETITKEFHIINDRCFNEGIVGWQKEKLIARHFYELGLNARKEE